MKPLILVTNDDGIYSKGIRSIISVAINFGEVVVVAPDKPQSGMGHAITINNPLRLNKVNLMAGVLAYSTSGTPVDCVKLGLFEILKKKPDLIISGINHGENTSTNVLYSGTMSAAVEGAMESIPSIGFSLADFDSDADFNASSIIASKIIKKVLSIDFPSNICLNVNIPKLPFEEIKGIKTCKQANAFWNDRFEKRTDQFGNDYYWLTGDFCERVQGRDTDLYAIRNGYVSIVPTHFDMTAHHLIKQVKNWKL
tara:strand:+ start:244 stop:1005 length:762 start_codon:yes stop_codon:yes gene_type:complete